MAGPIGTNDLQNLAVEPQQEGLTVKNVFAGTLAVGTLVYVNGTTTSPATGSNPVATVTKADADAGGAAGQAAYVVTKAMAQNAFGKVAKYFVQRGVDTSAWTSAGDPVYLSVTAGTSTNVTPLNGNTQIVGYVAVKSVTAGIIVYDLRSNPVVSYGALSGLNTNVVADQAAGAILSGNIGIPVRLSLVIPDGSTGNVDFTGLPYKVRVREARVVKTSAAGGASDTVRVANGATTNWITNAFDINVADQTVVRATTIDDAFYDLAAGATIRVVRTKSSAANVACVVTLELDRVA
jgi:hypothetical protein